MALSKDVPQAIGVTTSYHKISDTKINWHEQFAEIIILSFVDQASRESGKDPVTGKTYTFYGDDFDFEFTDNIVEECYLKLKAMDEWSDSIDV